MKRINKIIILIGLLIISFKSQARIDLGYMMRFGTFTYTPRATNQGIDGNIYNINSSTASDIYFSMSRYFGNWNIQLYNNTRSTTYKIPSNIPVAPTPNNPQTIDTNTIGLKFGYGKANIMPFFGIVADQIIYQDHQNVPTAEFKLKTEAINYLTIGGTIFGTGNKPNLEAKGSMELLLPMTTPTINSRTLEAAYITQINVEIKFGKNRNFGLLGSLGFHDYKDINEYHLNYFSGGIILGF